MSNGQMSSLADDFRVDADNNRLELYIIELPRSHDKLRKYLITALVHFVIGIMPHSERFMNF